MAFVAGPSPFLGRKDNKWAYQGDSSGYSPPESPDAAPEPYMPGPVSSLLDYKDFKAIAKHSSGYVPQGPTTSWADVVDQSVRDQQRRERGMPNQPTPGKKPPLPGQEQQDQQQADPEQAQREMLRQQNEAKIQATRGKLQQAQRLRQAAEQQQAGAQEKVSATKLDIDRASQQLKNAQDDLDDWKPSKPGEDPPNDLTDEVDRWQQALKESQAANDDARSQLADATSQVEEASRAEDTANKELQQLEADQAQQDQQAQQADQEAQQRQSQQEQQDQAPTDQPTEGPYGQAAATDQANPEQGQAQPFGPPSAEPGQPGQPDQQDPVQRAIAQVKAQGGNADNLLDAIAAEAWKQESGRAAPNWMDPNDVKAYDNYRASWVGAFRAGQDVPLAGNLRAAAGGQGAPPPSATPQKPLFNGPTQQGAPAQQAPYDPNQPVSPANQPPANPNLIGGPDRPPLAGPGAVPQPGAAAQPGVGAQSAPGTPPVPGAPTTGTPGAPGGPALDQANQTLAAAQARDAQLQKQLEQATSAADAAQKKMEAAQEAAGKLSKELSSGVGSPEYRQYSLGPALNKAQGDVSAAAQQLASARARAAQTQQMLATSQQSIAAAQNLVKLASVQPPSAGPAASVARDAGDAAQAGQLLNTMLAKATPEQQQRIIADITTGGPAGTEVLRQIATQAWYKQLAAQGQTATAGGPPRDYIESWMGMFRANQTGAPLIAALKAELAKRGAAAQPGAGGASAAATGQGPAAAVLTRPEMLRMTPQERSLYDEWVRAGGSGRWEDFQQHAVAVGAPQPGNRRVYTDPRDAGINPPSQGGGPAGSVLPAPAQPSAVQAGIDRGDFPATPSTTTTGYDAYIKAMRQAGDTRSDSELAAEFLRNTTTYPSLQQGQTPGPAQSVLQPPPAGPLPDSSLTLLSRNDTVPMVYGEDGTSRPLYTGKVYPPQLPPEQRGLWDEWRRAGGSGNWEQFQQHARAVGAGEIGPQRISDPRDAGANPAAQTAPPPTPVLDPRDANAGPAAQTPPGPTTTYGPPMQPPVPPMPRTITSPTPLAGETSPSLPAGAPRPPTAPGALPSALAVDDGPESIDPIAVTAHVAGVQDDAGQANIANGIAAWARGDQAGAWAEDYVDNAARLAWWKQQGSRRDIRPEDAPPDYVAAWKKNWLAGDESSPLQTELNSALQKWGLRGTGHQPGADGFDWRQVYGENGERLAPRQKYGNDCGPTAALAFGRAVGLDPDQDKILAWARSHGYHDGNQFQGTGAMQRMLGDMGIKSEVGTVDWGRIDQELAAGRPVMLSGPGHYWVISGKDPVTGAYYTGQTGDVVHEGVWEKPGQFRYGGGVNQAVYMVDTNNPAGSAMVQGGVAGVAARPAAPAAPAVKTPFNPNTPPVPPTAQPVPVAENYADVKALFESGQIPTVNPGALPADQRSPEGQAAWARAWAPTLEELSKRTGIDPGVLFGLITSESGWGTQMQGNNVMGLMVRPGERMQFNNPTESILYAVQMWSNPAANQGRYQVVWANRRDPNAFVNALANSGYADKNVDNISSWSNILLSNARVYNRAMGR